MSATPSGSRTVRMVRRASAGDVEASIALLRDQFPGTAETMWRDMIDYAWMPDKPDHGLVLEVDGTIRGFLGTMYCDRVVRGARRRFCHLHSWCVEPAHRRYSRQLLAAAVERRDMTYIVTTPRAELVRVVQGYGFRHLDERKHLSTPLALPATLRRWPRLREVPLDEVGPGVLPDRELEVLAHHRPLRRTCRVLAAGRRACLFITRRMYYEGRRRPATELYYVSDRQFLRDHFEPVKLRFQWQDRTIGLCAEARVLGFTPPGAQAVPASDLAICEAGVEPADCDVLYTELMFLP